MTTFEIGAFTGAPMGAAIGWVTGQSHGVPGIIGGSLAGVILGVMAGLSYAGVIMFCVAVIGALWRASRKDSERIPNEIQLRAISKTARVGVFVGVLAASVLWRSMGVLHALVGALAVAVIAAFIAVARYEFRQDA